MGGMVIGYKEYFRPAILYHLLQEGFKDLAIEAFLHLHEL